MSYPHAKILLLNKPDQALRDILDYWPGYAAESLTTAKLGATTEDGSFLVMKAYKIRPTYNVTIDAVAMIVLLSKNFIFIF